MQVDDQPTQDLTRPTGNGVTSGFRVRTILYEALGVFAANQRGFWRLVLIPWILLFFFRSSLSVDARDVQDGGPETIIAWLITKVVHLLVDSAIVCPMLVAWHQLLLQNKQLPTSWFASLKYDRTSLRFLIGVSIFYGVIGVVPAFAGQLFALWAFVNTDITLIEIGMLVTMAIFGLESVLLLALFRMFLVFPELATGKFDSLSATWRRSAPAPMRFFAVLFCLYLANMAIVLGVQLPTNINIIEIKEYFDLSYVGLMYVSVFVFRPIFILISLAAAVIGAITLSLCFQHLSRLPQSSSGTVERSFFDV